jgi:plasmid stabilization system protein ParE
VDFKVLFSDEALNDISEIVESIAGDNPDAASRMARSIIDHIKVLQYFPRVGTIVSRRRKARWCTPPTFSTIKSTKSGG